jgi:hypothetical protein
MTMRKTPYLRLRYPWASDVVNAADVQSMAADIDQALVNTANMAASVFHQSSVIVQRVAAQSITKATLTTITFDTLVLDNGTDSPLANGAWWSAGSPTRLTAPSPCVVLATGIGALTSGSAMGTSAAVQTTITKNGASSGNDMQGSKYGPLSTDSGYQATSALSMWKLNAGDYLELKVYWTGGIAGPINTQTPSSGLSVPTLALMMVALPTVP